MSPIARHLAYRRSTTSSAGERGRHDRARPHVPKDQPPVGPDAPVELPKPPHGPPEPATNPVPKEAPPPGDGRRKLRLCASA